MQPITLSNEELFSSLKSLVREGTRILANVLAYLAEVEDRKLHLRLGCSSMFDFCMKRLNFSESETHRRLTVARLGRRYPRVLQALAEGKVHLSGIYTLRDVLTAQNVDTMIASATNKSKREIEMMVARLAPKPDVPSSIRKLPDRQTSPVMVPHAPSSPAATAARTLSSILGSTPASSAPASRESASGAPESRGPASGAPASRESASGAPESLGPASGAPESRGPASGAPESRGSAMSPSDAGDGAGDGGESGRPASEPPLSHWRLAAGQAASAGSVAGAHATCSSPSDCGGGRPAAGGPGGPPANAIRARIEPLSAGRYRVQLTASQSLRDKLEHARALMSHRNPSGDLAPVLEKALDLLIERLEGERLGKTERPRDSTREPKSPATVTRAVRREVIARDGMQCAYVGSDGARCTETHFLELDHKQPRAVGGSSTVENVRVLCRAHNRLAAEDAFGREYVASKIDARQQQSAERRRDLVRRRLTSLGLSETEVERALAAIDAVGWGDASVASLVRLALGVGT